MKILKYIKNLLIRPKKPQINLEKLSLLPISMKKSKSEQKHLRPVLKCIFALPMVQHLFSIMACQLKGTP
jgi:hypothetical protein